MQLIITVYANQIGGTMYLLFEESIIAHPKLTEGSTIGIKILGIRRKNEYFEREIIYRRKLTRYTNVSLKMTVLRKYAVAMDLRKGDLVNIEILDR